MIAVPAPTFHAAVCDAHPGLPARGHHRGRGPGRHCDRHSHRRVQEGPHLVQGTSGPTGHALHRAVMVPCAPRAPLWPRPHTRGCVECTDVGGATRVQLQPWLACALLAQLYQAAPLSPSATAGGRTQNRAPPFHTCKHGDTQRGSQWRDTVHRARPTPLQHTALGGGPRQRDYTVV